MSTSGDEGLEILVPVAVAGEDDTLDDPPRQADEFAVIRVIVTDARINQQVFIAWAIIAAVGVGLLALAAYVAARLARTLTRPVSDLAGVASRLEAGDLTARVDPAGPPELREVGHALNRLAARIGELLAAERESVADVSHRLRTPLAALRLEAGELRDPDERERAVAAVDALSRALGDVIRQAQRPMREGIGAVADARQVVAERTDFWSALADDQDRRVRVVLPDEPLLVKVAPDDLAAAVDALLENVFAHTPEGSGFEVMLAPLPGSGAVFVIEDRGQGGVLADESVQRGRSDGGSTGLGLDIARSTAEASGGRLRIGRSLHGGTSVRMELGPVPEPALPR